jgi:hypothetical protein
MTGNAALLKCSIPSFVADFLHVVGWIDSEGVELAGGGGQALGNSHHTPCCLLPFFPSVDRDSFYLFTEINIF